MQTNAGQTENVQKRSCASLLTLHGCEEAKMRSARSTKKCPTRDDQTLYIAKLHTLHTDKCPSKLCRHRLTPPTKYRRWKRPSQASMSACDLTCDESCVFLYGLSLVPSDRLGKHLWRPSFVTWWPLTLFRQTFMPDRKPLQQNQLAYRNFIANL